MATISKQILSGSTNGTGITVANTATVGTTIHATAMLFQASAQRGPTTVFWPATLLRRLS